MSAIVASLFRKEGAKALEPIDFMPYSKRPEEQKPNYNAMAQGLLMFAKAHNQRFNK